jgi:hypothetical protein
MLATNQFRNIFVFSSAIQEFTVKIKARRVKMLRELLCGCELWFLTFMEEHGGRVLRRIFGPKRDEVTGGWRRRDKEEPRNLHS